MSVLKAQQPYRWLRSSRVGDRTPAVIVISGGNIQPEVHQEIVEGSPWKG
jgi:hypothetical protein